jgi:RNA polymerase sigma factor (sigma-70 family)
VKPVGGSSVFPGVAVDPQLAEFCRLEWARLFGSLVLYMGDRNLAEDLAQETLIRVCQHWSKVRRAASPSAWAHRVAFNLAKSQFRRQAVRRRFHRAERWELAAHNPDTSTRLAVQGALADLPEPQRRALVLRYFADLSVQQVAVFMGCPSNTVKTHTRRALESLRDAGLLADDAMPRNRWAAGRVS